MVINEFSFFMRTILPSLFLVFPAFLFFTPAPRAQILLLFCGGAGASIIFAMILGKRIIFSADGKTLSIQYQLLGLCLRKLSMQVADFQHVTLYQEYIAARPNPVFPHDGAYICSLSGASDVILKTSPFEAPVLAVAKQVSRLTNLPLKNLNSPPPLSRARH